MGNPLVADAEAPSATAGTGLIGDVANLAADGDPLDFTLDGVSFGLDAISAAMDPFGAIASAGVGWLLNHVSFLREPIDKLTGDAAQIEAVSQTWSNVAEQLGKAAQQYSSDLSAVSSWSGQAADDYRTAANDYLKLLDAIAGQCGSTAQGIEIVGILVGTERALVYDALSSFIGRCVVEAIAALASSWFTFGASIGAFLAVVDVDASIQAEKFAMDIGALLQRVGHVVQKLDGISEHADELGTAIARAGGKIRMRAGGMKGLKTIAKNRFLRDHPDDAISTINQFEHALRHSPLNNVHDVFDQRAVRYPMAGVKQWEEDRKSHAD
ncbi:MAG TPA: PPE domain-containing protein [Jatrophihabitans sp.]|nr:PPE domain-containing protein [Jatrophihabitans sp.]